MTDDNLDDLPPSVREIAEVIGRRAALRLVGQLPEIVAGVPGRKSRRTLLYVPKTITPDHRLYQILGPDNAEKLARRFGGEMMHPANCRSVHQRTRDEAVRRMVADGANVSTVSAIMRISPRQIKNILNAGRPARVQSLDTGSGGADNARPAPLQGQHGRDH